MILNPEVDRLQQWKDLVNSTFSSLTRIQPSGECATHGIARTAGCLGVSLLPNQPAVRTLPRVQLPDSGS